MSEESLLVELNAPLNRDRVKQFGSNAGAKKGLSYLEGHDVIRELNKVFDFKWSHQVTSCKLQGSREYKDKYDKDMVQPYYLASVQLSVMIDGEPVVHDGIGGGSSSFPDYAIAEAHEFAAKEAETDALKRAAMKLGDRFGLALYDKTQEHVEDAYNPKRAGANLFTEVTAKHKLEKMAAVEHIKAAIKSVMGETVDFVRLSPEKAKEVAAAALNTTTFKE